MNKMLTFAKGNSKLDKSIYIFSLPAGHTCPFAKTCKTMVDKDTGKLTQFGNIRCFAASSENLFPSVRKSRWNNFNLLNGKTMEEMVKIINNSIPKKATRIRIHGSGDFFNETYFKAWMEIAKMRPNILFYAYTKSIPYWKAYGDIPSNMVLTASFGGLKDKMIKANNLKSVEIVMTEKDAKKKNIAMDHDDSLAMDKNISHFGLYIHGKQAAKSSAAKAISTLRKVGIKGYSKNYK